MIEKHVVLVGAGNAHLQFVKRFGMRPLPGVAVTMVSESSVIPYSAMVPAYLGGDYESDEITIDLVRFCRSAGVRFVPQRVSKIEPTARQVSFGSRPPLTYDVLSIGLGSLAESPREMETWEFSTPLRPLTELLQKIDRWSESLHSRVQPFHLIVVGGGASGCELALAIHKRLGSHAGFRITLLQGNARLLPQFPPAAEQSFRSVLEQRGIEVRVSARVIAGEPGMLRLDNGERLKCDAVLWATHAAAHPLVRDSGLDVDRGGFLIVKDTLQSVSDPTVFGTGDCVAFQNHPELAKNGVLAVKEGAILFHNVAALLLERPLVPFRPQRFCLALLNTADGQAVLSYGAIAWKSRLARLLKDRIDRAWIAKFTRFAPMASAGSGMDGAEAPLMRCGGCGSKISSDVLSAVLGRIECPEDSRILLGCQAGEDAAVYRMRPELYRIQPGAKQATGLSQPERSSAGGAAPPLADELLEVQTVDYFKAFLDDPYVFGQIAALHSLSDLYAMNARPFAALAIATLPFARGPVQEQMLFEMLSGATHSFREARVALTGGHTTEGHELALGFSVTGHVEAGSLFQKGRLRSGELLILTKPLGTGALLAAWMRGMCKAGWYDNLIRTMLMSNALAAKVFGEAGVTACTDVTGFGFAGHLLEMIGKGQVSARLVVEDVPRLAGFDEVVAQGVVSTLHADNAKIACRVHGPANPPAWLFDPQTSGGLLAAVSPDKADETVRRLADCGFTAAAVVGEIVPLEPGSTPTLLLQSSQKERRLDKAMTKLGAP